MQTPSPRRLLALAALALLLSACAPPDPLAELRRSLRGVDDWMIVLEDMRQGGTFSRTCEHQYRVVIEEPRPGTGATLTDRVTDWRPVACDAYRRYADDLGLVVLSSQDGVVSADAFPPGFQYVGDERFGRWERGPDGSEVWTWLIAAEVLDEVGDAFEHGIRRRTYREYRQARAAGRSYTAGGLFGTSGSATQRTHPGFFERQRARQQASRSSFSERVGQRVSRSGASTFRSRSGGFGK